MGKKKDKKVPRNTKSPEERLKYKDFYSFLLGSQSDEILDEKDVENQRLEIEANFLSSLKRINEETLQLSEFLIEDKKLAQELCGLLREILKRLNLSFVISPSAIPTVEKVNQIILNQEGNLVSIYEKLKVDSKALETYPTEIILVVFLDIIPKLGSLLRSYRKKVGIRVNFFEKIYRELENVNRAFVSSNQRFDESLKKIEEDAIKKTLFSKKGKEVRAPAV